MIVLDFISNYEKAGRTPLWLGGEISSDRIGKVEDDCFRKMDYTEDCIVDFGICLIDLFWEMEKKGLTVCELIKKEYYRRRYQES